MKQIVYLITSNGVDGRGKESIDFAVFNEETRNNAFNAFHKYKTYYSKVDRIIDVELQQKQSLAKLNALDKLLIGI